MKTTLTLLFALFISILSLAQQGINYKAIIKDGSGNVIANDLIAVQFEIREGTSTGTAVFTETHTPTTDANGLIILTIGSVGTGFDSIDWGSDAHFLNVQVDTGGGLVDLGTTQFMAVPYALNVTGLEAIDEGNGKGWRLIGSSPSVFGSIGFNAIDLSIGGAPTNDYGATGSFAIALGNQARASGDQSISIGSLTTAESYRSTAFGSNNIGGGFSDSWVPEDPLFEIGNSLDSNNKTNALTVLKNGTITAPSFDISEITDEKALITKEFADANYNFSGDYNDLINQPTIIAPTGFEYLDETDDAIDNGGWRLVGRDPANYGPIGNNAVDLSISSSPNATRGATGLRSTAMGSSTEASGPSSTAMGSGAKASGSGSTAMGSGTIASGSNSTAIGSGTVASGNSSTSMGFNTTAPGDYSLTIGRYNVDYIPDDPFYEKGNDPIFVIGNGYKDVGDNIFKSNALTVLRDGNSIFYGEIQRKSTGSANMVPIAYGSFDGDDGTDPDDILSGTDNFTVTRAGDFTYTISVTGESLSAINATASVTVSTNFFRTANVTYSGGNMLVHIFSSTFNKVPAPFQFIIYKE